MKFTDGYWKTRARYDVKALEQVYDILCDREGMTIFATTSKIDDRSQTLGGPVLKIRLEAPREDIIKVSMTHYIDDGPSYFEIYRDEENWPRFFETEDYVEMRSGNLTVRVQRKGAYKISFYELDKLLTTSGVHNVAYITTDYKGAKLEEALQADEAYWSIPEGHRSYMREQLAIDMGEYIYGLGERFTPFIKNGQVVECWNADGGTSSEQAYKNIPFYLSNKGYGVFVNHSEVVSFEIATQDVSHVQFSVPGERLEYFIIGGSSPKNVMRNYTALTGLPALPPAWSFGLWLTTSFTTGYDEVMVHALVEEMEKRKIPLEVFHFDSFWMKACCWCDFEWDEGRFPNPLQMIQALKAKGLKISLWINPYIAQRSALFCEGEREQYFIKQKNGKTFQADTWQPGMAIVDFTNPEACEWYSVYLDLLLSMGVDCFKTDGGERIPTQVVYANGANPERMHNYYTYLYNEVVYRTIARKRGRDTALVFARSATVGSQKYPVHWAGGSCATYMAMAASLRGGLSLCSSGFGFWGHDIGGYEEGMTPDLYKRWVAFGLLSTHSRLHGNEKDRVPWLVDQEAVDVLKYFTKLKGRLMPYLFGQAVETSKSGVPCMRPMFMEYFYDVNCAYLDRQYMLGENIMIAPVLSETGTVTYYLPEGVWTNLLTYEVVEGGRYLTETFDYFGLPVLVRENSIVVMGDFKESFAYDYLKNITLEVYGLRDYAETRIYNANAKAFVDVKILREGNQVEVSLSKQILGGKLLLVNYHEGVNGQGLKVQHTEKGILVDMADKVLFTITL